LASIDSLKARQAAGKNSIQSTKRLFDERNFYNNEVSPAALNSLLEPVDFINKDPLYGKVDLDKDFILPNTEKLVVLPGGENINVKAFDFVASALADLQDYIKGYVRNGWLSPAGPIAECKPKKGYVEFQKFYEAGHELHYFTFVSKFIAKNNQLAGHNVVKDLILNFSDFYKYFMAYLKENSKIVPFSMVQTMNGSFVSPLSTGLCVEIADDKYDDDGKKHSFMNDPNFNFFRIAAIKFGFRIDRNVPWRLVADVRSYKMREYMRLAYEKEMIEEKKNSILEGFKTTFKNKLPQAPSLADIVEGKAVNAELVTWNEQTVGELREAVKIDIYNGIAAIIVSTKDSWEFAQVLNAKDPYLQPDTNEVECTDNNMCRTRIYRFDKFFETYYKKVFYQDFYNFKKKFYQFYKSYILENPTVRIHKVCAGKTITKEIILEDVSWPVYNVKYKNLFWLKTYFDIRLAENGVKMTPQEYKKEMKQITFYSKINADSYDDPNLSDKIKITLKDLDTARALMYINNKMRVGTKTMKPYYSPTVEDFLAAVTMNITVDDEIAKVSAIMSFLAQKTPVLSKTVSQAAKFAKMVIF
jgi:hypothetical protein